MPKYRPPVSAELVEAQEKARDILKRYFRKDHGVQAQLSRDTGIQASFLSRMAHDTDPPCPVTMENAIVMDVATQGELKAEVMCPARADLIQKFLLMRSKKKLARKGESKE